MNWRRVFLHIFILLVARFVAEAQFGYIEKFLKAKGFEVPWYITFMDVISTPIIAIYVFARLATIQQEKLYRHAWAVGIGVWLLSLTINMLNGDFDVVISLMQIVLIASCLGIGVAIGSGIYNRRRSKVKVAV